MRLMDTQMSNATQPITITCHARQRAFERLDRPRGMTMSRWLSEAYRHSIKLPFRYGRQLSAKLKQKRKKQNGDVDFRIHGSLLMVCRSTTIITVWKLSEDQTASTVWYAATGQWV